MNARDELAAAYDPDAFNPDGEIPKHPVAQIQWAARRKLALDAADRVLASDYLAQYDAEVRAASLVAGNAAIEVVSTFEQDMAWIKAEGARQLAESVSEFRASCAFARARGHQMPVFERLRRAFMSIGQAFALPRREDFTKCN